MEWISVKERPPETSGYYLIVCKYPYYGKSIGIDISYYQHKAKNWKKANNASVTCWALLPEPPKEESPTDF